MHPNATIRASHPGSSGKWGGGVRCLHDGTVVLLRVEEAESRCLEGVDGINKTQGPTSLATMVATP